MSVLGTVTPLGERARGSSWPSTAAAYIVGSIAGGLALGATLGGLGSLTLDWMSSRTAAIVLIVGAVVGLAVDSHILPLKLPSTKRQVNDSWIGHYRAWVYAAGFGLQLGTGVLTIVRSSVVYVTFLAALLTTDVVVGGLIGGLFGLIRGATILLGASSSSWTRVVRLTTLLESKERVAWTAGRLVTSAGALAMSTAILIDIAGKSR